MDTAALVELLTVADHFQLQGLGVVVTPHLALPPGGWKASSHTVLIATPDGTSREVGAHLEVWHLNIGDPAVAEEKRWPLVLRFPAMTKDEVPIGSRIMISQWLLDQIQPPEQ
jgi:hypothetical protein